MSTLFFTCANAPYEDFIPLYAYSVLRHVKDSRLEFGVEDVPGFLKRHGRAIGVVQNVYGTESVKLRAVPWSMPDGSRILPNTVRFINEPETKSDYVYIGDVDIIVVDPDLVGRHLKNMEKMNIPYSNSVRPGTKRMSGLHFAPMDSYYPVVDISDLNVGSMNDEELLYELVRRKGFPILLDHWYRPSHGIHISPNRPVLKKTDDKGHVTPGWGIEPHKDAWKALNRIESFRRLRGLLSQRVKTCLTEIDHVVGMEVRQRASPLIEL